MIQVRSALFFALFAFTCAPTSRAADDTPPPAKPGFVIGVWFQPSGSFPLWKARGINTLVGYESESNHTSLPEWSQSAADHGLFTIRQPNNNVDVDLQDPMLLAYLQGDEPDVKKVGAEQIIQTYARWKRLAPNIPVMLNVSGGNVLFNKTPKATYLDYLKGCDWVGNDFYPVTGWNHPDWLAKVTEAVEVLRQWSGGKPQFAFIETSNQQLAWLPKNTRGPSPDEVRAEIWDSVIHGVKGIVYFPQQFNPFSFDATPSKVSIEMARQNRKLAAIDPILGLPANPTGVAVAVNAPMEVGWRKTDDGKLYLIVLNFSGDLQHSQAVEIAGFGGRKVKLVNEEDRTLNVYETGFVDNFDPYDVHIYELDTK